MILCHKTINVFLIIYRGIYKLVISHNYRRQGSRSDVDLLPEATWLTHMVKLVISINHG